MPRRLLIASAIVVMLAGVAGPSAQQGRYRTLDDTFPPPVQRSLDEWKVRAAYLREHILATAGLLPLPEKNALNPVVFGDVPHQDYIVSKVYFESLPGFLVTGNLYRPIGNGPFPAHPFSTRSLGLWAAGELGARVDPWPCHQSGAAGVRGLHLRHDRLQRQPAAAPHVRWRSREIVGSQPRRASALEQHPGARFPPDPELRQARRDWRDRRVGWWDADLPARRC